jgi:hypothetical protein
MKKRILACLLLLLLLVGCAANATPHDDISGTDQPSTLPPDSEVVDARIAYYEQLVSDLRREILEVKTELYVTRVEYESRIAELEAEKQPEGDKLPEDRPAVSSQFTYAIQNGAAVISAYIGNEREVRVPSTLDGYPVCAISDRAFSNQTGLLSVTLPDGITSIGWFAFSGCIALERVHIPASVRTIAYGAFENCPAALVILCPGNSYAAEYAASYGIATRSE